MKSLFINTSSFFMSIAILENDKLLYKKEEEIPVDMATRIIPFIEECFNNVNFNIEDIDKIFVVNGPGSFTGVRIGVTAAKVLAWTMKKDIIPLSSLEVLASTYTDSKYRIPLIDARRGYVFAGVYDSTLNNVMEDKYISLSDLDSYKENATLISYDNIEGTIKPNIDILTLINKHMDDEPLNPHSLNPNYLKITEAEENLVNNSD